MLNYAAVIGRSFELPLLEQIVPREQAIVALSELSASTWSSRSAAVRHRSTGFATAWFKRWPTPACSRRNGERCTGA